MKIICQSEIFGGWLLNRTGADIFSKTMNNCNLADLGFHGLCFRYSLGLTKEK